MVEGLILIAFGRIRGFDRWWRDDGSVGWAKPKLAHLTPWLLHRYLSDRAQNNEIQRMG
jgi:hypothetical protein